VRIGGLRRSYNSKDIAFIQLLDREGFKLSYSDSLVSNIHHLLHKGGFYIYPSTKEFPQGKIRLMIEAKPLSFIVKAASGETNRILDLEHDLYARIPFIAGEKEIVEMHKRLYQK
jgi:fructose-1,6-bisphosphatase I